MDFSDQLRAFYFYNEYYCRMSDDESFKTHYILSYFINKFNDIYDDIDEYIDSINEYIPYSLPEINVKFGPINIHIDIAGNLSITMDNIVFCSYEEYKLIMYSEIFSAADSLPMLRRIFENKRVVSAPDTLNYYIECDIVDILSKSGIKCRPIMC